MAMLGGAAAGRCRTASRVPAQRRARNRSSFRPLPRRFASL